MSDPDDIIGYDAGCRMWCLGFILTCGITILCMWLDMQTTSNPKCFIQEFYVPALNTTDHNSTATGSNTTIMLHLRFENVMWDKGVLYDEANLTVFYGNNSLPVTNHKVSKMKLGDTFHRKVTKKELVQTHGVPWAEAYHAALRNDSHFRVGLATRIRFRIWTKNWYINTNRHNFVVGANVTVDYSGHKNTKRKIRLMKSGGPPAYRDHLAWMAISILFHVLTLGL